MSAYPHATYGGVPTNSAPVCAAIVYITQTGFYLRRPRHRSRSSPQVKYLCLVVGFVPSQIKLSFKILLMLLDIVNLNIYMFLKLVDGRKDAPRFIMIKSKLSQQMIVFRTDFLSLIHI